VTAPRDGKVKSVDVAVGDAVEGGQALIEWDD
jgi:methylmalonyl-CoA carboxyltransferase small subunit